MPIQIEPLWWITAVEAPVVTALFWMIHGLRRDMQERIERGDQRDSDALTRTRDELAQFKIEVARTYVPLSLIRDLDRRISDHLIRIEEKLEEVSRAGIAVAQAARRMEERE
ncbi:hypothetical protein [Neoroseomonas lacus]|jgi:hypothetical protein|uniref:Uncharacterized protein n=1 Tax=Neoroseomonas lacus TaxID=287609 RepID=A0A917NPD1_9PROT|nr:hypothetical protein [Neoroseomonas lacus]GGJ16156.1 hypothetical protein GCM10011320_24340 [Neoroseomonas lacus]